MAARLAMLRFIFRAHLQEERGVEPVVRCRPSPPPFSFGTRRFRGVERVSIKARVPIHIEAGLFRSMILERLRLPLHMSEAHCDCGIVLDREGRHRAVCARSCRLRARALAPERSLATVRREAGATVRCNARLRDLNVAVSAQDDMASEIPATGQHTHVRVDSGRDGTTRSSHGRRRVHQSA